ncbi:hypothetical protein [Microbacterium sp. NPDC087591]|uniref:hypothetical protein n=1 Tax=Microbacterium sp. NPDC087591 TaxID=3364192 RepID=UPI00381213A6
MTSLPRARWSAAVVALIAGVALAGCAPEAAVPTPAPTPTRTVAPASPTPVATEPGTEAEEPTQKPETPAVFTEGELRQICIDATRPQFDADVVYDDGNTRIEKRAVSPEWLVLVPVQTNGYEGEAACTIGGSPSDPDLGMAAASVQRLSEDEVQAIIRGEDGAAG